MATEGCLPAGPLLGRLRKQTTCPKCHGRFKQPKLLPCNHSVCRDCLSLKQGVRKGRGLDYIVTCPACEKEAELTKNGLDSLPAAFFKEHMTSSCARLEKVAGGRGCEDCRKTEAELTSYCRDCQRVICQECHSIHSRLQSLSEHVVVKIEEYARELGGATSPTAKEPPTTAQLGRRSTRTNSVLVSSTSDGSGSSGGFKCAVHEGEPLKFYCSTCNTLICHDCTVKEHPAPRHKAELVEKVVLKHRSDVETGIATIQGHLKEVRNVAEGKAGLLEELARQKRDMCRMLDHVFQELQLELEHRKRKIVKEVEKKTETEAEKVSSEISRLEVKSSELENLIETCRESLLYTSDQEFMVLRRDLQARLKEVVVRKPNQNHVITNSEAPSLSLSLSFSAEIESACREVTQRSLAVCPAKSRLEKAKFSVPELGREVQIVFSALAKDEKSCIEPLSPKIKVTVPRFEQELDYVVVPGITMGTYLISFTPTKKGEHLVSVELGGEKISNSPLRISIRSSKLDLGQPEKILSKKEWPWGVACHHGDRLVYVTENYNHRISVLDKDGKQVKHLGQKGQKQGQILHPTGIAVSQKGEIFVADGKDFGRVQKLSQVGQQLAQHTGLNEPYGVTLNPAEDRVYVCESGSQQVAVFDATDLRLIEKFGDLSCSLEQDYEPSETLTVESPHSLAIDSQGKMYVTDTIGQKIHVYDKTGTHVSSISHPYDDEFAPSGIAIDGEHIFVADRGGNQVVVMTTSGEFVTATGSYGTAHGQFQNPSGVAMDLDGYLYICDFGNSRVQVF